VLKNTENRIFLSTANGFKTLNLIKFCLNCRQPTCQSAVTLGAVRFRAHMIYIYDHMGLINMLVH